ncbi:MAG: phosphatase PAP2 family protein [Promethearchaeota archaeon]
MTLNLILSLLIFIGLIMRVGYVWTGALYSEGEGYRLDHVFGPLDNLIPFVPEMAIFYVFLFFTMIGYSFIYFVFIAPKKGYPLAWSLIFIGAISLIVYIFFPVSTYWWRIELFAIEDVYKENFWAKIMYGYYRTDTSFNCFPSLHAAVSVILAFAWYQNYKIDNSKKFKIWAIINIIIAIGVVLSTLFVKQHYIIDEITGVSLAWVIGKLTYTKLEKDNG